MDTNSDRIDNRTDVVADAIAAAKKADEMRGAAIKELLAQQEQIARDLKTLGYVNGSGHTPLGGNAAASRGRGPDREIAANGARRFRNVTLAQAAKVLLAEAAGTPLHGAEIERLAKLGGFTGGTKNFQNYLPVALKRAGGIENIGGNRWRLNEDIPPQRPER